jgi:SAM-dependent methyltransferase
VTRRGARPTDRSRWIFNRLAGDYRHRPGYPRALVDRLLELAGGPGARLVDLGAGTGQLALPLARLGAGVHAVEPAEGMLDVLRGGAGGLEVVPVHAAAEETGLAAHAFDLVLVADAIQWIDPERGGREIARLLAPGGVLAVVLPRLADTPFLRALLALVARANPKARRAEPPVDLVLTLAGVRPEPGERFRDEAALEPERLDAVLRSLSFVGPALGPARLATLLKDARALAGAHGGAIWSREIGLRWGRSAGPAPRGRG